MLAPEQRGARLSVVVEQQWRAMALAEMITECGLTAEVLRTDEGNPLVRTAPEPGLIDIAAFGEPLQSYFSARLERVP